MHISWKEPKFPLSLQCLWFIRLFYLHKFVLGYWLFGYLAYRVRRDASPFAILYQLTEEEWILISSQFVMTLRKAPENDDNKKKVISTEIWYRWQMAVYLGRHNYIELKTIVIKLLYIWYIYYIYNKNFVERLLVLLRKLPSAICTT